MSEDAEYLEFLWKAGCYDIVQNEYPGHQAKELERFGIGGSPSQSLDPTTDTASADNDEAWIPPKSNCYTENRPVVFRRTRPMKKCPYCETAVGSRKKQCPDCKGIFQTPVRIDPASLETCCLYIVNLSNDLKVYSSKKRCAGYHCRCFIVANEHFAKCYNPCCIKENVTESCCHVKDALNSSVIGVPLSINLSALCSLTNCKEMLEQLKQCICLGRNRTPVVQQISDRAFCVVSDPDETATGLPFVHTMFRPPSHRAVRNAPVSQLYYVFSCECSGHQEWLKKNKSVRDEKLRCKHYYLTVAAILSSSRMMKAYNVSGVMSSLKRNPGNLINLTLGETEVENIQDAMIKRQNRSKFKEMTVRKIVTSRLENIRLPHLCVTWHFSDWFMYIICSINDAVTLVTKPKWYQLCFTAPNSFALSLSERAEQLQLRRGNLRLLSDTILKTQWRFEKIDQMYKFFNTPTCSIKPFRYFHGPKNKSYHKYKEIKSEELGNYIVSGNRIIRVKLSIDVEKTPFTCSLLEFNGSCRDLLTVCFQFYVRWEIINLEQNGCVGYADHLNDQDIENHEEHVKAQIDRKELRRTFDQHFG